MYGQCFVFCFLKNPACLLKSYKIYNVNISLKAPKTDRDMRWQLKSKIKESKSQTSKNIQKVDNYRKENYTHTKRQTHNLMPLTRERECVRRQQTFFILIFSVLSLTHNHTSSHKQRQLSSATAFSIVNCHRDYMVT